MTSGFVGSVTRWSGDCAEPPPLHRWSGAHLLQGRRRLTSGFSFRRSSKMRVSRVDFSGLAQRAPCRGMQGVRGAMWPVRCGFVTKGASRPLVQLLLHVHAQGMRTHCPDQGISRRSRPKESSGAQHGVEHPGFLVALAGSRALSSRPLPLSRDCFVVTSSCGSEATGVRPVEKASGVRAPRATWCPDRPVQERCTT